MLKTFFFRLSIPLAVFILFFFCKCKSENEKLPDLSSIHIDLKTDRFDLDLYGIDTNHVADGLVKLHQKYPDFLNYFLDTLMDYGIYSNYNDTVNGVHDGLRVFITFKDFVELEDSIKNKFPDTKDLDEKILLGFKSVKYYLPNAKIPKIIYLNMGLSKWPSFPVDSTTFCVGLDMFLGVHFPYYASIGVQPYLSEHLKKTYIPVSVLSTYYRYKHPFVTDDKSLIDLMIQRGKEQYFLHKVLPNIPESTLFGFTDSQLEWCKKYEAEIYNFFIKNNILYDKVTLTRFDYINDGPFAQGMESPTDSVKYSPGNVGTFIGYKIVTNYMKRYSSVTLNELINQKNDAARFLDSAKYRPR